MSGDVQTYTLSEMLRYVADVAERTKTLVIGPSVIVMLRDAADRVEAATTRQDGRSV